MTTPLPGHSLLRPDMIDVTDTDLDAKASLQLCLDPAGRNLWVFAAHIHEPRLHRLGQFVRMPMAIIQESQASFLLVASQLDEAVGSRARNLQLTLGSRGLPRVTSKHRLDELQARGTIRAVFHPFIHPFQGASAPVSAALYHLGLS
jgi:hypothetical protein